MSCSSSAWLLLVWKKAEGLIWKRSPLSTAGRWAPPHSTCSCRWEESASAGLAPASLGASVLTTKGQGEGFVGLDMQGLREMHGQAWAEGPGRHCSCGPMRDDLR